MAADAGLQYGVADVPDVKIDTPDLPDDMVTQLLKKSDLSQPGRCECPACKEVRDSRVASQLRKGRCIVPRSAATRPTQSTTLFCAIIRT